MQNIRITQFRSLYNGEMVTMIDYNPVASRREKAAALQRLQQLNATDFIRQHRPDVYADLVGKH